MVGSRTLCVLAATAALALPAATVSAGGCDSRSSFSIHIGGSHGYVGGHYSRGYDFSPRYVERRYVPAPRVRCDQRIIKRVTVIDRGHRHGHSYDRRYISRQRHAGYGRRGCD